MRVEQVHQLFDQSALQAAWLEVAIRDHLVTGRQQQPAADGLQVLDGEGAWRRGELLQYLGVKGREDRGLARVLGLWCGFGLLTGVLVNSYNGFRLFDWDRSGCRRRRRRR